MVARYFVMVFISFRSTVFNSGGHHLCELLSGDVGFAAAARAMIAIAALDVGFDLSDEVVEGGCPLVCRESKGVSTSGEDGL